MLSGILRGIHSDILSGIFSGMCSDILSGMCAGPRAQPDLPAWPDLDDRVPVCACPG